MTSAPQAEREQEQAAGESGKHLGDAAGGGGSRLFQPAQFMGELGRSGFLRWGGRGR